ncbi:hypothetical protein, partial [Bosea sp. FBZP-16]|uniref:hypothetical protein n=1 Tax=Bosea sp. FBZP-16 TaxID=2065382 RepID=UPI001AEC92CC
MARKGQQDERLARVFAVPALHHLRTGKLRARPHQRQRRPFGATRKAAPAAARSTAAEPALAPALEPLLPRRREELAEPLVDLAAVVPAG